MDALWFPTAGPSAQVLALTLGLPLKINWRGQSQAGGVQTNHPPTNSIGSLSGVSSGYLSWLGRPCQGAWEGEEEEEEGGDAGLGGSLQALERAGLSRFL